jgi:hypothetical protein
MLGIMVMLWLLLWQAEGLPSGKLDLTQDTRDVPPCYKVTCLVGLHQTPAAVRSGCALVSGCNTSPAGSPKSALQLHSKHADLGTTDVPAAFRLCCG